MNSLFSMRSAAFAAARVFWRDGPSRVLMLACLWTLADFARSHGPSACGFAIRFKRPATEVLATVLGNLQVVLVAFAAWAVLGERPERRIIVAVPVKYFCTSLLDRPIASKICAPQ